MGYAQFHVGLATLALFFYVLGVSTAYWLTKDFHLPYPPPEGIDVDDHMGLFYNCKDLHFHLRTDSQCNTEGANDWQFVATGMAIVGLLLGLVTTLCTWLHACWAKVKDSTKFVIATSFLALCAASFMSSTLIMFALNNRLKADENLHYMVEFDQGWSYYMCVTGASLYSLLVFTGVMYTIRLYEEREGPGYDKTRVTLKEQCKQLPGVRRFQASSDYGRLDL